MTGVEALLRWHHPQKGLVLPDQFMSTAEDTGLVVPSVGGLSRRRAGNWPRGDARSRLAPDLTVSVNVSGRQLEHDHFVTDVAERADSDGHSTGTC